VSAVVPGLGIIKIAVVVAFLGGLYYTVWSRGYDRCERQHAAATERINKEVDKQHAEDATTFERERAIGDQLARDFAESKPGLQKLPLDEATATALNKLAGETP
jgi:flagellar biosynthesis component FlhA